MINTGDFIGGCIVGGIFTAIVTLALTTYYWLNSSKQIKQMDDDKEAAKIKHINKSHGGLKYNDGLDIDSWI